MRNIQVVPEEVVRALYSACRSGNFDLADKEVKNVIAEGYPVSQTLSQVILYVIMEQNQPINLLKTNRILLPVV